MKPKTKNQKDTINALLQETWEELPSELEQLLMEIPAQVNVRRNASLDRVVGLLNGALLLWGMGLSLYFWHPLTKLVELLSNQSQRWGFETITLISHPIFIFLVIACLSFMMLWLDSEKNELE